MHNMETLAQYYTALAVHGRLLKSDKDSYSTLVVVSYNRLYVT